MNTPSDPNLQPTHQGTEAAAEPSAVLRNEDLRIQVFTENRGGMQAGLPEVIVKVTHLPTGRVAYGCGERSQHANRSKAIDELTAALQPARYPLSLDIKSLRELGHDIDGLVKEAQEEEKGSVKVEREALRKLADTLLLTDPDAATVMFIADIRIRRLMAERDSAPWSIDHPPRDGRQFLVELDGLDKPVIMQFYDGEFMTVNSPGHMGRRILSWRDFPPIVRAPVAPDDEGLSVVECANCECQYDASLAACPECQVSDLQDPEAPLDTGAKAWKTSGRGQPDPDTKESQA